MANITIYVSDKDKEIFEEAKSQKGSLSKIIAMALKEYIKNHDDKQLH
jgi:hypothetical protein